ncbi:MAG: DNA-processing protein DprA [Solirubrobacterales bacterium]
MKRVWTIDAEASDYPGQLADLDRLAPPVLHGVGQRDAVAALDADATVTIVGSRRASAYGLGVAEQIAADLAASGATIVSGMALGIDAAAHRGALAGGGRTIAVLAGGPDVVYPARESGLYRRITTDQGAAISEHPAGVRPQKADFPARNRIMAALARFVLIVEAAEPSGSLITARLAQGLGREVGAVPGQVGTRVATGTNGLLRDGAAFVSGAQDILDRLAGVGSTSITRAGPPLDEGLLRALDLVERGARTADELAVAAEAAPSWAAVALAQLELLGYVKADSSGAYARTTLTHP